MRTRRLAIDGLGFHVRIAGDGPPLVLLHGFPDTGACWRHQIAPLAALGRTVIVPDQRGCGATDMAETPAAYRVERLVQDVVDIVDALAPDAVFDLVGHDWGAAVGWHLCATHPERVRRFAALSVGHPEAYRRAGAEQRRKGWYLILFITPWLAETVLRTRRFRALTVNAPTREDAERWVRDLSRPQRLTAGLNWYRANLARAAIRFHLPAVTVPTLGLYGTADVALAEDQMTGSEAHVAAPWRYARFEGVGHWLQIEAAAAVNDLLARWFTCDDPGEVTLGTGD